MRKEAVVDLAPNHKTGLTLANPVMPAAGCFGFGMIATIVRRYGRAWGRCPVPIIVHVAGTSPGETASCCRRLASVEVVAGIELGLSDTVNLDDAIAIVQAARATANHPLIVRLPLTGDCPLHSLCEAVVEAGADALTIAAPPRGTARLSTRLSAHAEGSPESAWHEPGGRFVTGRLYGPLVHPLALRALRRAAELVSAPLIGCGGVHSVEDARAFLHAGATAVQVSGALWRDPACLAHIARSLSPAVEPR
jgi:dihydroorotate dehydrogenase (NAD+) catalytic subunit